METRLWRRRMILLLLIAGLPLLFGCDLSSFNSPTSIKNILDNPRDYEGKTIFVSGAVTDVFSLFIVKSFALRDQTGEIIVITERILPKKGASIKVKGKVIEAFSFGDKTITAMMEVK